MVLKVKMGDIGVGKSPDSIETLLGSCVAIILYDRGKKIGGLAHIMLPKSRESDSKSPGKYADTAVPELLERLVKLGARRDKLVAKIAGGAAMFKANTNSIDVGKKNIDASKDELKKVGLRVSSEDTGGESGRTVVLSLKDGNVTIRKGNEVKNI
ncbi:CheD, stimulates methylation of MCP proteins [Methanococcus vannielii SB]|jgi:chemotaxis protein CheD|uniref:Probable chemoreceptor glutamine deamidase CheD n=1 Tax=Methanococcus vannielii (strain ATCC 35089 / DSM 1224 / JCM 13029 / OCM 148 / SB) TaxID=406327 RepID=CHED_METVS|nr:chemotaxis protein CheD [Methanococcus vannielii]A6UNQ9.1 RecName: Full=Probable chemoreceptor glutamine deamidase CheD [Methanococcus vannielii SB]ABR54131.1 CheD, stimulates methylation of MCP proteins [Methanococcus vannielii SB]